MKKIVITGSNGFIGSNMVEFLKKKGHFVRAVIRKEHATNKERYTKADEVKALDLSDINDCKQAVKEMDYVFHFASNMGGVKYFYTYNYSPFIDNMRMDMNMLDACAQEKIKRVFYPASACVYPTHVMKQEGKAIPLTEKDILPANSNQMYGWEKLMMILLSREAPIDVRVGIFDTIFGENQEWEGERAKFPPSIVAKVAKAVKHKTPIVIWGNGKQIRSFLYISDALEKVYEIMFTEKYFGEVNIASDESVTIQQCADWLCQHAGITPKYNYDLSKPSGVISRKISTEKFKKHYTYRDKVSTRDGFIKIYQYLFDKI